MFTIPDPLRVADGTYLVRPLLKRGANRALHVNSMIITGAEPVLVDTGPAAIREQWLEQTFCLVDPADVRWIFLSHPDADHVGNLSVALEMCQRATVITSWAADDPRGVELDVPDARRQVAEDGDVLDLPDRRLVFVRPPTFDTPVTLGVYDTSTGVYWASDGFGAAAPGLVDEVADLPGEAWAAASDAYERALSPWVEIADPVRFGAWVDRVDELAPTAIASAHGPLVSGGSVEVAIARLRLLARRAVTSARRRGDIAAVHPAG